MSNDSTQAVPNEWREVLQDAVFMFLAIVELLDIDADETSLDIRDNAGNVTRTLTVSSIGMRAVNLLAAQAALGERST